MKKKRLCTYNYLHTIELHLSYVTLYFKRTKYFSHCAMSLFLTVFCDAGASFFDFFFMMWKKRPFTLCGWAMEWHEDGEGASWAHFPGYFIGYTKEFCRLRSLLTLYQFLLNFFWYSTGKIACQEVFNLSYLIIFIS